MTFKVAMVGAGYFAALHRESWERLGTELVGVADLDIAKARGTGCRAFANVDALLLAQVPDVLDVVLPPASQAEVLRVAFSAGVPTVICQKPFCASLEEARKVTEDAGRAGTTLVVHENFRFQPWYRAIRRALDEDRTGAPMNALFQLRPGDGQGSEAYLARQPYFREMSRFLIHETGVHWIDTFRYLFGDAHSVYADLRRLNPAIAGEDAGLVIFDHGEGVRAVFDGNRHLDHKTDQPRRTMGVAVIEGTEGTLTLDGTGAVRLRAHGAREGVELLGPDTSGNFGGDCVHRFQTHLADALAGHGPIETLAADYLRVLEVEAAIYRSAEIGARVDLM